ncbi:ABC transporter permease [Celerinatantimonas sp. YJH-8]|uniref:ABC transporter permease n=1 Tax=Celerinatantimonas sp. YJH-8 TaxID=3228714 RepID=UPI0038C5C154
MVNSDKPNAHVHHSDIWRKATLPITALILIMIVNAMISPNFFTVSIVEGHLYGSLIDIVHRGSPLIIMSVGMSLVIATGGIDLSVGAVVAIAGAVMAVLIDHNYPGWLIILATLATGALCGLWNGILVAYLKIQPIIATLILMVAGRGIAQMITSGQIVTFHSELFSQLGDGYWFGLPIRVIFILLAVVILALVIRRSALGLFIESVGGNTEASRLAGIDSRSILIGVYMLSGLCAGFAGMIITADISGADANNAGLWMEMDAILAVVIGGASLAGGRFYLGLTLLGALVIQSLTISILVSGLPAQFTLVVKAIVIVLILLIQSPQMKQKILAKWRNRHAH